MYPKLKKTHQTPVIMNGHAILSIPKSVSIGSSSSSVVTAAGSAAVVVVTAVAVALPLMLRQTSSLSLAAVASAGKNGRTRMVPARKPTPTMAWRALVNGRDLSGPIVKMGMVQSAVMKAPRRTFWMQRMAMSASKLRTKGMMMRPTLPMPNTLPIKISFMREDLQYLQMCNMYEKPVKVEVHQHTALAHSLSLAATSVHGPLKLQRSMVCLTSN
jgi:hypothetical protein